MKLHTIKLKDRKCIFIITFKKALIIHEENMKENHMCKKNMLMFEIVHN
jgi:hypothetical protein